MCEVDGIVAGSLLILILMLLMISGPSGDTCVGHRGQIRQVQVHFLQRETSDNVTLLVCFNSDMISALTSINYISSFHRFSGTFSFESPVEEHLSEK